MRTSYRWIAGIFLAALLAAYGYVMLSPGDWTALRVLAGHDTPAPHGAVSTDPVSERPLLGGPEARLTR